jgi:DNA-binding beta-propeller fold protein YncE
VYVADQGNDRVERFTLDPSTLKPTGPPALSAQIFAFPQGIALDPGATRVYVADDDNNRVVVLDPQSLAMVAQLGTAGTGPGQFENPYDVAVDDHQPNQLYVADNQNNRVDVFDASTLAFLGTFGSAGHTVGSFSIVRAVGALGDDPRGGVDVADTANNRIQALDPGGALLAAWGIAGRGPGYFTRPRGVAFDPAGGVTVADTFDHRIERFDPDGTYSGQFGLVSQSTGFAAQGAAPGQFDSPGGVAYDTGGNLWVADTGNDRVVEIRPSDGAVLFTANNGEFGAPRDVAAGPAGSVYVADTGNGQVSRIDTDGTIEVIRSGLSSPAAVAWDGASDVFAADAAHVLDATTGVQVAPPAGETSWDHPAGLAIDPATGTIYVSEQRPGTANGARVVRGTPSGAGTYSWDTIADEGDGPAQVIEPAGLALSPDGGTLLVADQGNERVLRFDAPGHQAPQTQPLTVALSDITRGTVTSAPAGIACATDCVQHYGTGRQVTLTATPFPGSQFGGWSGACAPAGAAPTCTVGMAAAQSAGATFAAAPPQATPPPPPPPPPPVAIAKLRLSTRRLHLARPRDPRRHRHSQPATRARVSLTLTRAARLTITVEAGKPGRRHGSQCLRLTRLHRRATCTRYVPLLGRRTLSLPAGASTFTLTPALRGRPLKPGAYRLSLVALDSDGNRVGPVTARFTVTR